MPHMDDQATLDAQLLAAVERGDAQGVIALLRAGAAPDAADRRGRTAVTIAVFSRHADVVCELVAAGADVDRQDADGFNAVLACGVTGDVAVLRQVLRGRPDLTIRNRYGGISVIPASERGHVDYVRRVVQTDIDVNHVNDLGWTALLEAVILGDGSAPYQQIVRILLDAGADPAIADGNGVTALEHARGSGQTDVARILLSPSTP
jgi:uncharacterized protein